MLSQLEWKRKPNFFIAGAPKCGTTSLFHYLRQHPDVFMTETKEMHFFGRDLGFQHRFRDEALYRSEFDAWGEQAAGGEASVWYSYSKEAANDIYQFNPNAKIVIALRNPTDMVHAQHAQATYVGSETIPDFDEALAAEEGRRSGEIPTDPHHGPKVFYYRQIARYTEQLKRFVDLFGREQVHIIVFDDLKSDVNRVYAELLTFLGVDSTLKADLHPRNTNRRFKNKTLHYWVNNPNPGFKRFVESVVPEKLWRSVKARLQQANTSNRPRDPMKPQTRAMLNEVYADEVAQLSEYLSRDLTHWSRS